MKACICSFTGYKELNGSNLRAYFLANELIRRGIDLTFVVPSKSDAESCRQRFGDVKTKDVGMDIYRFSSSRLKKYPIYALRARKLIPNDAAFVFGQSLPSALAVRFSKTKALKVIDYVDLWSEYWLYAHNTLLGKMLYRCIKKAEKISLSKIGVAFTITKQLASLLIDRGCPKKKIRIVRDGVDTKMFRKLHVEKGFYKKHGLDSNTRYIIYQGGIGAHDGVQFLVDAAPMVIKQNPDVKFLIVGAGDYAAKIRQKVSDMGLNSSFIFTGWMPYSSMPYFMNIATINCVPLPDAAATRCVVTYKLFESLACGVPTIIGDLPGVKEAVKHNNTAYLVKSEDSRALSNAINTLFKDNKLRSKLSRNGLKLVKGYDWRDIAKDMADIILSESGAKQ